jgi:hypothetical protein
MDKIEDKGFKSKKVPLDYLYEAQKLLFDLVTDNIQFSGRKDYNKLCFAKNFIDLSIKRLEDEKTQNSNN